VCHFVVVAVEVDLQPFYAANDLVILIFVGRQNAIPLVVVVMLHAADVDEHLVAKTVGFDTSREKLSLIKVGQDFLCLLTISSLRNFSSSLVAGEVG
jgi:hypothetical protein